MNDQCCTRFNLLPFVQVSLSASESRTYLLSVTSAHKITNSTLTTILQRHRRADELDIWHETAFPSHPKLYDEERAWKLQAAAVRQTISYLLWWVHVDDAQWFLQTGLTEFGLLKVMVVIAARNTELLSFEMLWGRGRRTFPFLFTHCCFIHSMADCLWLDTN